MSSALENSTFGNYYSSTDIYNNSGSAEKTGSCNVQSFYYPDYIQIQQVDYFFVCLYGIVILLSGLGNALVIWTVVWNKHMRTITNLYILNLAIADLLVSVFVMPLKMLEYAAPCDWGIFQYNSLCSFLYFILPVIVFTSVLTLMAISLERLVKFNASSRYIYSAMLLSLRSLAGVTRI